MVHLPAFTRRSFALVTAAFLGVGGVLSASPALAAPGHDTVVSTMPAVESPNIKDGTVFAIHDAGDKIIAGGTFTTVRNRDTSTDITRHYLLSFDKATGRVDAAFAPVLDGSVSAIIAGPTPGTVYVAGDFTKVNEVNRRKLALINVADGSLVDTWKGPGLNGLVNDIVKVGDRLLVGGIFTTANGTLPRGGLVSLNANTGAVDNYLTTALTEHHNYTEGSTGVATAGVGAEKLAVSPDGTQLVVIGNFKKADGVLHDQIVRINLGDTAATIADWNTDRYTPACLSSKFDSYVRDVAWSPDGKYFVVVTTGAKFVGTLCDTAARWEAAATGDGQQPTWVQESGADTFLSVGISEKAVYVGGHFRWLNNPLGADSAGPGATARPSIAALDPANGLPLAWNPGRHPRGYGVTEMLVTSEGVWMGHDQDYFGNGEIRRERIGFFPLAGGAAPHSTAVETLPGKVYQAVSASAPAGQVIHRINAGGPEIPATDGGPSWSADSKDAPSPYHNTGNDAASYGTNATVDSTVPSTTPITLFNTERYDLAGDPNMEWDIPVAAGTSVTVRLYLANRYQYTSTIGKRKFDVSIDGALKLNDFDPVAAVGHNKGTMRAFTITSDGNVDIDFGRVVESPLIQGIEIVKNAPPPPPAKVLYRVNAGGPELAALDGGMKWDGDTQAAPSAYHNSGSNVSTYATNAALDPTVPASTPTAIYNTERYDLAGDPNMEWDFAVPKGTQLQVRLFFANRYQYTSTIGKRKFDVSIDGALKLNDFDIVAAVGHNKGTMRAFTITSDGNVDIDFGRVVESPLIQGIELIETAPPPANTVVDGLNARSYDGATAAGTLAPVSGASDTAWSSVRGAFWVGGTLFYAKDSALYRRTYNGTTFGTPALVDPYHSAKWDSVLTGSKPELAQTYEGATTNFYAEITNVTGMFYSGGRLYYTLSGQNGLFWRWFTPDSGVVGAQKFTVAGATSFGESGGVFVSGDTLYVVNRTTGDLATVGWTGTAPSGTPTVVSGPKVDGADWRGSAVFVAP